MSNEFNIDPNVWYQISNDRFDPSDESLRVGDSHTAIYMYSTNLTSPQQRWQIFPLTDGGGWNLRAQITASGAYMSQCLQLTSSKYSHHSALMCLRAVTRSAQSTDCSQQRHRQTRRPITRTYAWPWARRETFSGAGFLPRTVTAPSISS